MTTSDREIRITRLLAAPRDLVFKAFTSAEHLPAWWGPRGFTTTIQEIDVRPGGVWRFVMHGQDGTDYDNKVDYVEVVEPERLVYRHGSGIEDDPAEFEVSLTFEDRDGKTGLTMQMVFKTPEARRQVVEEFGAIDGANQTLDRLEELLATLQ